MLPIWMKYICILGKQEGRFILFKWWSIICWWLFQCYKWLHWYTTKLSTLLFLLSANKTNAKLIEDWECPNPNGIHRPVSSHPLMPSQTHTPPTVRQRKIAIVKNIRQSKEIVFPPGRLALIVIGSLMSLLLVIGIAAYCKAVRS